METTLSERVRMLRTSLNLTQFEFANLIDTTTTSISRIESGHAAPRKSTLQRICRQFNCSIEWLNSGKGEMMLPGSEDQSSKIEPTNWKEEAYLQLKNHNETLKQEVEWLKNLVSKMAGTVNFPNGIDLVGILQNPINTVRAAA